MVFAVRRVLRALPRAGASALCVILLAQVEGCRDNGTGSSSQTPQAVAGLVFALRDTLTFDAWDLDLFNYTIPPSHSTPVWRVYAVEDSYAGAGGVTSIAEYPAPGRSDTLRFRFLPSGDIYQYGFIAGVVKRREGLRLPPSWDRIGAFSLPTNATWAVGTVDSAGTDTLRGHVLGDQGYFIAQVNGVRTVLHGFGVSLLSVDIDYTIVISDVPPAFLLIEEGSTQVANGFLRTISSVTEH
jgi:hypothetical protein